MARETSLRPASDDAEPTTGAGLQPPLSDEVDTRHKGGLFHRKQHRHKHHDKKRAQRHANLLISDSSEDRDDAGLTPQPLEEEERQPQQQLDDFAPAPDHEPDFSSPEGPEGSIDGNDDDGNSSGSAAAISRPAQRSTNPQSHNVNAESEAARAEATMNEMNAMHPPNTEDEVAAPPGTAPPAYGGPYGTGSNFSLSPEEFDKLNKQEQKYRVLGQKILDRAGITLDGNQPFDLVVHNPLVLRRVIHSGSLGLGEAYMEGWWDTRDLLALPEFFKRVLQGGLEYYFPNNAKDVANIVKAKLFNPQTKSKSKKVGLQHYDIGNAFFEKMLGPTMQYSCAYWERHDPETGAVVPIKTLNEAQEVKLHMIAQKLRLKPGMEVLDVGCGWGTLAQFLSVNYRVKVTGITISEEQRKSAAERVRDNPDVTILNQDYRDLKFNKKFDRIVSVGMFEHVGPKNYKTYFKHMRRLLNDADPEAVFVLHTIGSKTTMSSADQWYLKYIFPGGCLPSVTNIGKHIEKNFVMEDWHNFGHFYGLTLLAWRDNFLKYWVGSPESQRENADVFFRTFVYYLSSSAGAFLSRDLQLWQVVLSPSGIPGYPSVVRP